MTKLDSLSIPEFAGIFDRVSMDIDLAGATTGIAIENRLKVHRHYAKTRARSAKRVRGRKFYGFKAEELDKLIEHDFSGRAIHEANVRPKGLICQTLLYGREEALKRVKERAKAVIKAMAYVVPEREVAEKAARGLALREKLRRRWYAR